MRPAFCGRVGTFNRRLRNARDAGEGVPFCVDGPAPRRPTHARARARTRPSYTMFLLRRLQDNVSRRLYKSVLKQAIGRYLEEELDVDQLDVALSAGCVRLNSLNIKPAALNDALLSAATASAAATLSSSSSSSSSPTPPPPFYVEGCSVDEFTLRVGALGSVLEDGCDIEVVGLTLDLVPGSAFADELRAIAAARARRADATAADAKARRYAAAAADARQQALRAAAAAEGMELPSDLAAATAAAPPQVPPAAAAFAPHAGGAFYDDGAGAAGDDVGGTADDAMAREHLDYLQRMINQIAANVRLQGHDIRLRFRVAAKGSADALDEFLELFLPALSFADETGPSEATVVERKVVRFSRACVRLVQGREPDYDVRLFEHRYQSNGAGGLVRRDAVATAAAVATANTGGEEEEEQDEGTLLGGGAETVLVEIGGGGKERSEDMFQNRVSVALPGSAHREAAADGSPLAVDVFFASLRLFVPSRVAVLSSLMSLRAAFAASPASASPPSPNVAGVALSDNTAAGRNIVEDDDSDDEFFDSTGVPMEGPTPASMLGSELTESQIVAFGLAPSPSPASVSSLEDDEEGQEQDDDDEFEDCMGPPVTIVSTPLGSAADPVPTATPVLSVNLTICCAHVRVSLDGRFADECPGGELSKFGPGWADQHLCVMADTVTADVAVYSSSGGNGGTAGGVRVTAAVSQPRIESASINENDDDDDGGDDDDDDRVSSRVLVSLRSRDTAKRARGQHGPLASSAPASDGRDVPCVVRVEFDTLGGTAPSASTSALAASGFLNVDLGDTSSEVTVTLGLDSALRWSKTLGNFSDRLGKALANAPTVPIAAADGMPPPAPPLTVSFAIPGTLRAEIPLADDVREGTRPHLPPGMPALPKKYRRTVFSSALVLEVADLAVTVISTSASSSSSSAAASLPMGMYALPVSTPGMLICMQRARLATLLLPRAPPASRSIPAVKWAIVLQGSSPSAASAESRSVCERDVWLHVFSSSPGSPGSPARHPGLHPAAPQGGHAGHGLAGTGPGSPGPPSPGKLFRVTEMDAHADDSSTAAGSGKETPGSKTACVAAENALLQGAPGAVVVSVPLLSVRLRESDFAFLLEVFAGAGAVSNREEARWGWRQRRVGLDIEEDMEVGNDSDDLKDGDDLDELDDDDDDDDENHLGGLGSAAPLPAKYAGVSVRSASAVTVRSFIFEITENEKVAVDAEASMSGPNGTENGGNKSTARMREYYRGILRAREAQRVPFLFRIEASHFQLVQGEWIRVQHLSRRKTMAAERTRSVRDYMRVSMADMVFAETPTQAEGAAVPPAAVPVLYTTKWGGHSKPARHPAFGGVSHGACLWITQEGHSRFRDSLRDMVTKINFYGTTLRYDVNSSWLFRLIPLLTSPSGVMSPADEGVAGESKSGRVENDAADGDDEEDNDRLHGLTQLRLAFHDSVIDYAPKQSVPSQSAGRVVLTLGRAAVSTNIVSSSHNGGPSETCVTISLEEAAIMVSGRPIPYATRDEAVCEFFDDLPSAQRVDHGQRLATWDVEQILLAARFAVVGRLDRIKMSLTLRSGMDGLISAMLEEEQEEALRREADEEGGKSGTVVPLPPPATEVVVDAGTITLFSCADSLAALVDVITGWQDEMSLTDKFLRARARVIPRRFLPNRVEDNTPKDHDDDLANDEIPMPAREQKQKNGQTKTKKTTSILSAIDHDAFGSSAVATGTAFCASSSPAAASVQPASPDGAAAPVMVSSSSGRGGAGTGGIVIIEDFYTPAPVSEEQDARWIGIEEIENDGRSDLFAGVVGVDVDDIDDNEDSGLDDIFDAFVSGPSQPVAPVVPSAPPMFDEVIAGPDDDEDEEDDEEEEDGSAMYHSVLGFDGWWNRQDPTASSAGGNHDHGNDAAGCLPSTPAAGPDGYNDIELKAHVVYSNPLGPASDLLGVGNALLQEEVTSDSDAAPAKAVSPSRLSASVVFHQLSTSGDNRRLPDDKEDDEDEDAAEADEKISQFAASLGFHNIAEKLSPRGGGGKHGGGGGGGGGAGSGGGGSSVSGEPSDSAPSHESNAGSSINDSRILYADIEFNDDAGVGGSVNNLGRSVVLSLGGSSAENTEDSDADYFDAEAGDAVDELSVSPMPSSALSMDDIDLSSSPGPLDMHGSTTSAMSVPSAFGDEGTADPEVAQAQDQRDHDDRAGNEGDEDDVEDDNGGKSAHEEDPLPAKDGQDGRWFSTDDGHTNGAVGLNVMVFPHYAAAPLAGQDTKGGDITHLLHGYEESLFAAPSATSCTATASSAAAKTRNDHQGMGGRTGKNGLLPPRQRPEMRFIVRKADVRVRVYGGEDFPGRTLPPRCIVPGVFDADAILNPGAAASTTKRSRRFREELEERKQLLLGVLLEESHLGADNQEEKVQTQSAQDKPHRPHWWEDQTTSKDQSSTSLREGTALFGGGKRRSARKHTPRNARRADQVVELHLASLALQSTTFLPLPSSSGSGTSDDSAEDPEATPPPSRVTSALLLVVKDIEVNDRVQASGIDKMLSHWRSRTRHPRESGSAMLRLAINVKSDDEDVSRITGEPFAGALEHSWDVKVLPLRLNVDQDTMGVLARFGQDVARYLEREDEVYEADGDDHAAWQRWRNKHSAHSDGLSEDDGASDRESAAPLPKGPSPFFAAGGSVVDRGETKTGGGSAGLDYATAANTGAGAASAVKDEASESAAANSVSVDILFLRRFVLNSISVKIDYVAKRVDIEDLRNGNYVELLNLVPIEGMRLEFPRVDRVALCGLREVGVEIGNCWVEALTTEQMYRCAAGVTIPPLDSLANLAENAANVVLMPLQEYNKDDGADASVAGSKAGSATTSSSSSSKSRRYRRKTREQEDAAQTRRKKRKNARVIRSVRNGLSSLVKAMTYEAAANASRVATTAHNVVAGTEAWLTKGANEDAGVQSRRRGPGPKDRLAGSKAGLGEGVGAAAGEGNSRQRRQRRQRRRRRRGSRKSTRGAQYYKPVLSNQPSNPLEGAQQAAQGAVTRVKNMARTVVMMPVASYRRKGLRGATRSVVRAVPVAILEPIAIVTETVSRVTLGMRNWVDPAKKDEEVLKWKQKRR